MALRLGHHSTLLGSGYFTRLNRHSQSKMVARSSNGSRESIASLLGPAKQAALAGADTGTASQTTAAQALARKPPSAVAAGAVITLTALAGSVYSVLSSDAISLPPLGQFVEQLPCVAATAATAAGTLALTKAIMGDTFHVELHRGRLYFQLGVPSQGPAVSTGSINTQPTGDVRGNGAYAAVLIPAGSHIADYSGDWLDRQAFFERYPDGVGDYSMAVDQEWVIDAVNCVACTSTFHPVHMNHSRTRANVRRYYSRREGRVAFFANRDIQPGEELLYDYGHAYWQGREHLELP